MFKRVLSMVLVLVTLVSVLPPRVEAEDVQPQVENSITMEGTNSFGNLLANTMNESPEAQTEGEDNRVCDLVIEGTTATVEYTTTKNAKVVVAVYTEDGTKMLGSGTAEVTPEETAVVVEIQISPMPTYYSAGAYLLDAKTNDPLSPVFRTQLYTKAVQDIKNSTVEDYDPEKVLNLDEDNTTNFAVFGDRTILVREDSPVQITGGDGVYTVSNADERFLGMVAGDSFAQMQEDGEVLIVKAAEVNVEGDTVTVWEDEDADLQDVFEAVKIDTTIDPSRTVPDESTMDPSLHSIDKSELATEFEEIESFDKEYVVSGSIQDAFEVDGKFLNEDNASVSVKGKIAFKLTAELRTYMGYGYLYVSYKIDTSLSGSVAITGKLFKDIPMKEYPVPFLVEGVYMHVVPSLLFEVSGSVSFGFTWKKVDGAAYDSNIGGGWQSTGKPGEVKTDVTIDGKVFVGLKMKMGVTVISKKIISLDFEVKCGGEVNTKTSTSGEDSEYHECVECYGGELYFVNSLALKSGGLISLKWTIAEIKIKVSDVYCSIDKNGSKEFGFSKCPHISYLTVIKVIDENDIPVVGAEVSLYDGKDGKKIESAYQKNSDQGYIDYAVIPHSNKNGEVILYLPAKDFRAVALSDGLTEEITFGILKKQNKEVIRLVDFSDDATLWLSETNFVMNLDDSAGDFHAYFGTQDRNAKVTNACQWNVSDENVVSVRNGKVTAVGPGQATVVASYTKDGQRYMAKCSVYVFGGILAQGEVPGDGGNIKWVIDDSGLMIISGNGAMEDSSYGFKNPWLDYKQKIKKIIINEGIETIGEEAFRYSSVETLVLPSTLKSIGEFAFGECENLTDVVFPSELQSKWAMIWHGAFCDCVNLNDIKIPEGIGGIADLVFSGCSNLKTVYLPVSLHGIGIGTFYECENLKDVYYAGTAEQWENLGLTETQNEVLHTARIHLADGSIYTPPIGGTFGDLTWSFSQDGVLTISGYGEMEDFTVSGGTTANTPWLEYRHKIKKIVIKDGVTSIGKNTFYGTYYVTEVALPKTLTKIRDYAFFYCPRLENINLPDGLEEIGSSAFTSCKFKSIDIPDSVVKIGAMAFDTNRELTQVVLPNGLQVVGAYTFNWCSGLKEITIPKSVKKIWVGAFDGCDVLHNVYFTGTSSEWVQIEIGSDNSSLLNATIHFSDGTTSQTSSLDTPEVLDPTETMEETEPTEETIPETTEEITPETTEESIEETTEETTAYPEGTYVAPEGGNLVETPVLEEMSMYTGKETVKNGLRTVAFVGLEPGEEYVLIVSLRPGSVASADLQYIEQAAASAEGKVRFTYIPRTDVSAIPQLYGISAQREIKLDREYLTMPLDALSEPLTATVTPEEWADEVAWSSEDENILTVDSKGYVTPAAVGTGYAVATVRHGKYVLSARCRVDVTEQAPNEEVLSIDLTSPKVTTDLYSTDYTQIDILPRLPQNEVAAFAAAPEDNGAAITGAYLEDETARAIFDLRVKDDRTLLVVPTQAAIEGAKGVKSSYSSKLAVSVNGVEYHTAEAVTIGVKKTLPKLKAGNLTFNPFYTGQSQALNITGGTVTKIEGTMPDWLELDGTKLTLKNAPKSGSASVNLLVYTEEWAVPVSVKVNVKLSYKAPAVKLSASSVSLSDSGSKGTTLKLSAGKQTLEALGVESIRLPEGFEETVLDLSTGEFNLVPTGAIPTGKQTVRVYFYDTDAILDLPLTVGKKSPTLKLSKGSINLNGDLGDSVTLKVTATPADLDLTKVVVTTPDEAVEVSPVNADGEFTVTVKAGTAPKANFPLTIQAPTGKAAKLTVKTLAAGQKVTMSLKAVGSIDLTYPEKGVDIQPVFKNYSGELENIEYDLGDFLTLGEDDLLRWNGNIGLTTGTYPVTVTGNLPDGTVRSGTVKVKVIQTAVALKLGKTSMSLNKRLNERVQLAVTSGTKGYTLGTLGIRVTDSKNVPSDGLTAAYADGLLTLAVNDRTAYGSTYKVQLWATSNKISTVTVKIPAEKASAVTMTAKAKGQIDVIRDASQVLVTPSYKNCLDGQSLGKQVNVTWAKDGKNYTQDVTGRFDLNWADSVLQVSRMPGETLELTGKYRLEILCEGMEKPAYVNLAVKSGTAKVTAAPVRLYTKDANHRAELTFMSSDRTLNAVARVELKDAKLKASYEVLDLGDGQFALRLRPGAKAKNGTVTVNLFFEGNNGKKPNATASVKVEIR